MLIIGEHIMHIQPERATRLFGQPGEETEDLIPAVVVAAERPGTSHVPGHLVGDQLRELSRVSLGERFVASACQRDIRVLTHDCPPLKALRIQSRLCTMTPPPGLAEMGGSRYGRRPRGMRQIRAQAYRTEPAASAGHTEPMTRPLAGIRCAVADDLDGILRADHLAAQGDPSGPSSCGAA